MQSLQLAPTEVQPKPSFPTGTNERRSQPGLRFKMTRLDTVFYGHRKVRSTAGTVVGWMLRSIVVTTFQSYLGRWRETIFGGGFRTGAGMAGVCASADGRPSVNNLSGLHN